MSELRQNISLPALTLIAFAKKDLKDNIVFKIMILYITHNLKVFSHSRKKSPVWNMQLYNILVGEFDVKQLCKKIFPREAFCKA